MTRKVFVIVPVKPLDHGKSRLASIMTSDERKQLNSFLMRRTFDIITEFPGASHSITISSDKTVAAEARMRGIAFVEDEERELNAALARATRAAIAKGAEAIIVLPVDLPLATSEDLKGIVPPDGPSNVLIIVPDRHRSGTNLLYVAPACEDLYRFGPGSFERHREAAAARGFHSMAIDHPTLSLDIDEPLDYERWSFSAVSAPSLGAERVISASKD